MILRFHLRGRRTERIRWESCCACTFSADSGCGSSGWYRTSEGRSNLAGEEQGRSLGATVFTGNVFFNCAQTELDALW
jgi:hypothetical protein